ncbi:MAG: amidohydrolase family protein [Anaerolineales bacterium]|nr:amidohydrolase family protein [Anaerolineales bacterium]
MDWGIIDTHLHVWDTARFRVAWLDDIPFLNRSYLPADYREACETVRVDKMVFIQAEVERSQSFAEAEWVAELARQDDPRITGIVAWAPLELGDGARPALERLATMPLVKGIRRLVQNEPDPEYCLQPGFVQGVRALPEYGLHCEYGLMYRQMAATVRLVAQCPDVRFILDHIGKPDIRNGMREPWWSEMRTLASFPNVWCKLSGLATEADYEHWTTQQLRPYMDHVLECFGAGRVMFGSDWPVIEQACAFPRWVEIVRSALSSCSESERKQVLRDNAVAFYRLE